MDIPFKAIILSHKTTALDVRERFAMDVHTRRRMLHYVKELGTIEEMLVISTCNRFEVYFTSHTVSCEQLTKLLKLFASGDNNLDDYLPYFQLYHQPLKAVEHLFRVSMGLESQVLADSQIIGQVKTAYQDSADIDMAGPFLHRLMHTVFQTHKRIVQ